jgi:hypothetical protein
MAANFKAGLPRRKSIRLRIWGSGVRISSGAPTLSHYLPCKNYWPFTVFARKPKSQGGYTETQRISRGTDCWLARAEALSRRSFLHNLKFQGFGPAKPSYRTTSIAMASTAGSFWPVGNADQRPRQLATGVPPFLRSPGSCGAPRAVGYGLSSTRKIPMRTFRSYRIVQEVRTLSML